MGYENVVFDKNSVFLVTGGAGFVGSNICEVLVNRGYTVRCLDDLSTGKKENIQNFINQPNFAFIQGDIRDYQTCLSACKSVDYVLHQAAWGSVPRSIEMPIQYEEINIKGTLNMMEAARQYKVKKFVYASSSSVYGDEQTSPKIEGQEGNLLSPYAITKMVNEYYGKIYSDLYDLDTYGLRYFNVFGKRQDPDGPYAAVIPKFINQLLNQQQPIIYGDGQQSRDFTYIENVIEANLKACQASSDCAGEVFNIAFGEKVSLLELFRYLTTFLQSDIQPIFSQERQGDIKHSHADISKAKEMLRYDPDWNFQNGIIAAISWFKENS